LGGGIGDPAVLLGIVETEPVGFGVGDAIRMSVVVSIFDETCLPMNQNLESILAAWDLDRWLAVGCGDVEATGGNLVEDIG
jgi:hypothetical protein